MSTEPDARELLLIRFSGDLTTKAQATRRQMTSRLQENLRASLRACGRRARLRRDRNRIFVELEPPEAPGAASDADVRTRLGRVFGVQSISPVLARDYEDTDSVVRDGHRFGAPFVQGRRFAVRARRVGDRGEKRVSTSRIERELGALLDPGSSGVDLSHPDVTVRIEVDHHHAYYFVETESGARGLPLGSEGRGVSLISGGFDSPVASWRMLRRGLALDYVFCNLGGRSHQLETLAVAKRIADRWQSGTRPRFHAIDFDRMSREIQARVATRYWQVVLKRMMLRAAEDVAFRISATAIVTGEALGQVSSQTLQNLSVIEYGAQFPILRPLIGSDKEEIIAESKRVGTHDLSAKVGEYCAIVPSRPATHARLEDILREEAKLDPAVLEEALAARSEFLLSEVDLEAWASTNLVAEALLPEDTVLDLRTRAEFDDWHAPGSLCLEFPQALEAYPSFDRTQRYVLYCEYGLKSAHLADLMRREGLDARHVPGGLRAVQRMAGATQGDGT